MCHGRAHALIRRYNGSRVLWPSHKVRLAGDVQDQGRERGEDISVGTPVTFVQKQAVIGVVYGGYKGRTVQVGRQ